jgi:hypothetical protein
MPPDDETKPDRKDGNMQPARGIANGNVIVPHKRPVPAEDLQDNLQEGWVKRFREGKVVLMTGKTPDKGLSIPYPILTGIVTIVIWLAGLTGMLIYNLATMNANFANLNTNLVNRDAQQAKETQALRDEFNQKFATVKGENDMLNTWIQTTRERLIKLEAQKGQQQ